MRSLHTVAGFRRWLISAGALVAAGALAAACGSSTPSAAKVTNHNKHHSTTTTSSSTTTTSTPSTGGSTTSTTAAPSKAGVTTTTAAKGASTPGGDLSTDDTSTPAVALTGVGASSIQPFYGRVFYQYNQLNPKLTINYSPSGSGPGITAIQQNTASFGQSEIPMQPADLAKAQGPVLQVPVDLGGVAISYHVSGVAGGLKLNGPVLAEIYLGTITTWNDPAIQALNPGVNLPSETIVPVHRADTSGPGYDLDQYLIDTSPTWTSAIGTTTASKTWPNPKNVGVGEQLNAGVATYIEQNPGTIGFVEYSYALQGNFTNASLLSHDNTYVSPSVSTIANAGAAISNVSGSNFNIVWAPGSSTYPLANFSWALLYQKQSVTNTGIALGKLFNWVITTGQSYSSALGYAPLPASVVATAHATLLQLETASGQPIFS
jgi:phosphate transport system substrate-binding protein